MGFRRLFPFISATIAICFVMPFLSCSPRTEKTSARPKKPSGKSPATVKKKKRVGSVLVLEYHKVVKNEARWDRSIDRFCEDLHLLYDLGFRPITISEYLSGDFDEPKPKSDGSWFERLTSFSNSTQHRQLPPGTRPVVITFDDSHPSQLRLKPDGSLDPDCAMGIWARFAKKHPDFPVKATFYVLPGMMWGQKKMLPKKLAMLKEWGCELGSHTMNHRNLQHLTNDQVKLEFAHSIRYIEKLGFKPNTIALPYGVAPRNRFLLRGFKLDGKWYGFKGAVLGGAGPAPLPESKRFQAFKIPRTQGISGFLGINYWLRRMKWGKTTFYTTEPSLEAKL